MELKINAQQKIKDVRDNFQQTFPHLKIAFYKPGQKISPQSEVDASLPLNHFNNATDSVEISATMRVGEIEKKIKSTFGLHAEVFRQSGKLWLQTSATDHWTLREQNEEGHQSTLNRTEKPEDRDYHEQE